MFAPDETARNLLKVYSKVLNRSCEISGHTTLPRGAKIIAMNHTDGCDPLFLPLFLDEIPYFLLQDGLFEIPLIGKLLKETGQIPVYRDTNRAKEALQQACALLHQGKTIVIFPEGKQSPDGQRIRAKTGTVRMALETGAPIIPLGLYVRPQDLVHVKFDFQGSERLGVWQFTGKSYMRFGPPWRLDSCFSEADQLDVHTLTDELMNLIYRLVSDIQKEIPCESHFSHRSILPWSVERLS
jgi:1-acyl-sn-glycerol-3-phosphate acyltransferase